MGRAGVGNEGEGGERSGETKHGFSSAPSQRGAFKGGDGTCLRGSNKLSLALSACHGEGWDVMRGMKPPSPSLGGVPWLCSVLWAGGRILPGARWWSGREVPWSCQKS